jgi:hypothetical protein
VSSPLDVRLVPLRSGRWVARIEGRIVRRSEADRPSSCLIALGRVLDTTARARPEALEAADERSPLFASTVAGAGAATVLAAIRDTKPANDDAANDVGAGGDAA